MTRRKMNPGFQPEPPPETPPEPPSEPEVEVEEHDILVQVKHPGFGPASSSYVRRRAGHTFTGTRLYKPSAFTEEQWAQIKADKYLRVQDPHDPEKVKEGSRPTEAFKENIRAADEERAARKAGDREWTPDGIPKPKGPPPAATTARPPEVDKGMVGKVRKEFERLEAEREAERTDPMTIDPRPPAK